VLLLLRRTTEKGNHKNGPITLVTPVSLAQVGRGCAVECDTNWTPAFNE